MKDKYGIHIKEGDLVLVFGEYITKYQNNEFLTKSNTYYVDMDSADLEIIGNMNLNPEKFLTLNPKELKRLKRIDKLKASINAALN